MYIFSFKKMYKMTVKKPEIILVPDFCPIKPEITTMEISVLLLNFKMLTYTVYMFVFCKITFTSLDVMLFIIIIVFFSF